MSNKKIIQTPIICTLDPDWLNSFTVNIPFKIEVKNNINYYVIKDETLCKIFWIRYIHDYSIPQFKIQNFFYKINKIDLSYPVYINESTLQLELPKELKNIHYFGEVQKLPEKIPFNININSITISIIFVLLVLILAFIQYYFKLPIYI